MVGSPPAPATTGAASGAPPASEIGEAGQSLERERYFRVGPHRRRPVERDQRLDPARSVRNQNIQHVTLSKHAK
jgi:hypothetical protein